MLESRKVGDVIVVECAEYIGDDSEALVQTGRVHGFLGAITKVESSLINKGRWTTIYEVVIKLPNGKRTTRHIKETIDV